MKRRRIRRYQRGRKNSGMKFAVFIGIMILAVVLGYVAARFLVAPAIGYDTDVLKLNTIIGNLGSDDGTDDTKKEKAGEGEADSSKQAENSKEVDDSGEEDSEVGYALQFGVFSTKSAAEKLAAQLDELGIETKIVEKDDQYKVMSEILKTKSDAIERLKEIQDDKISDVFITKIEKR